MRSFDELFRDATGHDAYHYQLDLATREALPSVLDVPTGAGKTQALILSWLYGQSAGVGVPRRLVYALPMRALVEQTARVAACIRKQLGISPDELPIRVLMGGVDPGDWAREPERPLILIGTIDMLLSRALGRGFGESRFAWPISFGLLNSDCRWVFDEVQLMGPARATSAQLDGLRAKLGTLGSCETLWASATVDLDALKTIDRPVVGPTMTLSSVDRQGPLATRLRARKRLERVDLSGESAPRVSRAIAETIASRHHRGERTLAVMNTVSRAQSVARELSRRSGVGSPEVILVHSRFRPHDRASRLDAALAEPVEDGPGQIVVATQVVEAGVDLSCRVLVTETAPFSSIVQRLGRCNRGGEHEEATVLWLDRGAVAEDARGARDAAPYPPADLNAARDTLERLDGSSLSPEELSEVPRPFETPEEPVTLRRRDLFDLFDTSPDLSGLDVDVAPFIRTDDERNVSVFFRSLPAKPPRPLTADEQPAPTRDELVSVPLSQLRDRELWLFDPADEAWVARRPREVPPGVTVLLDAQAGGYDSTWGWDPALREPVAPAGEASGQLSEGIGSDPRSFDGDRQELSEHLQRAAEQARELADSLALDDELRQAVVHAAALHDLGKAHPVFQDTMRRAMGENADPARLWAKSGTHGRFRHSRPYFRHELGSALAARELVPDRFGLRDLVLYLIAAHHGRVRLSIRPGPDERPPDGAGENVRFALGIIDGDRLPPVRTPVGEAPEIALDLGCMELGDERSWVRMAVALRDDPALGPFRIAALEALVRIADWRSDG